MSTESIPQIFRLPSAEELDDVIVDAILQKLRHWLGLAQPGFCARLDDLSATLMERVAQQLYTEFNGDGNSIKANVRLLMNDLPIVEWECQWTEAVRLRNPDRDGQKRPPLLLLVPPGTELLGSLDSDTFHVIPCQDIIHNILVTRLRALPEHLAPVAEFLKERELIRGTSDIQRVRYLLAISSNGYSVEAAGLSLCILGLWPHRQWFNTGDQRSYWFTRNKEVVSHLRNGTTSLLERVYSLDLKSLEQARRLYQLLSSTPDLGAAAERVSIEQGWQDLDFSRWDFAAQPHTVVVTIEPPDLPRQEDGYAVLRLKEQPFLPLAWTINPAPTQVPDLTHYLIELLSSTSEAVEVAYTSEAITPGRNSRKSYRVKDLGLLVRAEQLPEGLYRVRVTAWAGATNITRQDSADENPSNISPYFWIKDEGLEDDAAELVPPKKERYVSSYLEARREVQWNLLKRGRDPWNLPPCTFSWDGTLNGKITYSNCVLQFGRETFRIRLSNLLRRIEVTILSKPESLGVLRADLGYSLAAKDVPLSTRSDIPILDPNDAFLRTRTNLFEKIRGQTGQGTVETCDLLSLREDIPTYAQEYIKLLRDAEQDVAGDPKLWRERVELAAIDTIRLTLPGLSDQRSVAILLAPTHPLRLLWFLQLALLGESWLHEAHLRGSADALTPEVRQALQGGLKPTNIPQVLFDRRRVGYLQAGQVATGWDIYLPADIADKQSALSRLARAIGSDTKIVASSVNVNELRDRILRYIKQHPYIGQLQLNVFNPGDGAVVVGLLSQLDKDCPDLRYDVRLFSQEVGRNDVGAALDQLVNPEITIREGAEKYSQSSKYPLHPDLAYSKNSIADFLASPRRFQAHLSLLLDMFRPRIDVAAPFSTQPTSSLFGLVHEEAIRSLGGQGMFAWERQIVPGPSTEITEDSAEAALLAETLTATQNFVAALGASPTDRKGRIPTVRLDLSVDGQNLLYEIHRISDWVLTLDRHLGIDYFDSATVPDTPTSAGILLDFSPEFPTTDQTVLLLTTRVDEEVDQMVTPVLQQLGIDQPGCSIQVIEWLRSLSGRLAMRLLSAPLNSQGVIGMALARAFLGHIGLLQDSIIIPADAHVQLLRKGAPEEAPQRRTDLILVRRPQSTRQIDFVLVEVKCTAGHLTPAAYDRLREEMEDQVAATQAALAGLFDPVAQNSERLDWPLRNQTLARLLGFYVGRARRYRLLSDEAESSFRELVADLHKGYNVSFHQTGIIFELGREDDVADARGELTIHRVGRLSCERFLRSENTPAYLQPSWEQVRTNIQGNVVWSRPDARRTDAEVVPLDTEEGPQQVSAPSQTGISTDAKEDGIFLNKTAPAEGERQDAPRTSESTAVCHYLVGDTKVTSQWGILGRIGNDTVALDLDGCNTFSLFGVQGSGKSYTMGSILEMALRPLPGLNVLPHPLAAVVFHYNESQDYAPEFVSMAQPNQIVAEIARLREEYAAGPAAINDILVLTPKDKVNSRRLDFPGLHVEPIMFHPAELTIQDWRFLLGAVGNDSLYIKELNLVMRELREHITVEDFRRGIEGSQLSENQKRLARLRLRFAEQFMSDEGRLRDKLYPGRLIIVDLRDELIETDEALGLFVVMLRVFSGAMHNNQPFNKWIAFDEAHKYIRNSDLVDSVVEVIRQMRHQGTSVLIASQDPSSLPQKIIELSSLMVLHRMDSPKWLRYIQGAVAALGGLSAASLARLRPGEAYLWARSATNPLFTHQAVKIQCRPRVTQHGGKTRIATDL